MELLAVSSAHLPVSLPALGCLCHHYTGIIDNRLFEILIQLKLNPQMSITAYCAGGYNVGNFFGAYPFGSSLSLLWGSFYAMSGGNVEGLLLASSTLGTAGSADFTPILTYVCKGEK